ncbi:MAG TPA: hypothetical protein VJN69_13580 [Candidatus Acidoferrales bacterium]|nr:hypothetical protein [Candidatus Acidoferrales bacterium]
MTRCLNCGAERETEVCEACGLEPSAAELIFRKKLLNRTGLFLLGAIAFVSFSNQYPPLEIDRILIFIGVLFFLTLSVAIWLERKALKHAELEALKRVYYGLIPIPWLLAGLLLFNGAFDRAPFTEIETHVVGKFAMPGPVPNRRLIVRSWREGGEFERIAVDRIDFNQFSDGDTIEIKVKDGLVGIPWVAGVVHQ